LSSADSSITESYETDCVVIGAGVVGLAIARAFALQGRDTILLEACETIGTGTSSRNSEVIHSGLYYAPGSLKAALCVRGKHLLYEHCERRRVHHRRLGKLIVAVSDGEVPTLEKYAERAAMNGVELRWLSAREASNLEPDIRCVAALFSPSTGIIDSHDLMVSLLADFEGAGGTLVLRTPVMSAERTAAGLKIRTGGSQPAWLQAKHVVNCAGLDAQSVAAAIDGHRAEAIPPLYHAIGHYFTFAGRSPFRHLIYPVPEAGGLGVHVTLDMAGRTRFGPDVSWRGERDFRFDESRAARFAAAIKRYFPSLPDGSLQPGYTGIRPKLCGPDGPEQDFLIQTEGAHGVPGLINLFGIESPGLTACLAIAEHVVSMS
jgi:L-2-hydroxyglutarate oxidase LhgO